MSDVDYSLNNLVQPVITATIDLPPREAIRPHKKIKEARIRAVAHYDDAPEIELPAHINDWRNPVGPMAEIPPVGQNATPGVLWRLVSQLQWRNRSDGPSPNNAAAYLVRQLSLDEKTVFVREYNENVGATAIVLTNIFDVRNIIAPADKLKIASHVIALGREQYRTFMEDLSLFEFLIDCDEAQSFDAAIRHLL